jgi:hypothetical protein
MEKFKRRWEGAAATMHEVDGGCGQFVEELKI